MISPDSIAFALEVALGAIVVLVISAVVEGRYPEQLDRIAEFLDFNLSPARLTATTAPSLVATAERGAASLDAAGAQSIDTLSPSGRGVSSASGLHRAVQPEESTSVPNVAGSGATFRGRRETGPRV